MDIRYFVMIAALSSSAAAFAAGDGEVLFNKNNCSACHVIDGKSLGPSVAAIAAQYKAEKGAQARLEAKVRKGGAGSFGAMPMPATANSVSDGEIKIMVTWMLDRK